MTSTHTPDQTGRVSGRSSKLFVALVAVAVAAVAVYLAVAMPGMDHGSVTDVPDDMSTMNGSEVLAEVGAAAFAAAMEDGTAFVINVHVPYDGEIQSTDAFIAYDAIAGSPDLPDDRDTKILLYCRSGRMSRIAGDALVDLGYRDVTHLAGGMDAWTAAGIPLAAQGG